MKCAECQELIQQRLDGLEPSDPAALELHLRGCSTCRALHGATGRLRGGILLLKPPAPPPGMSGRIAARLQADYRSRLLWRGRVRFAIATAAAVLLLVSAWLLRPNVPQQPDNALAPNEIAKNPPPKPPEKPAEESLDIRESVSEVSSVMVNAATRTTDAAVAEGRAFLPLVSSTSLPTLNVSPPAEPTRSLKEAGQGVSDGLAPVADSARRAFDLFLRDLPPMGLEEKPGL